MIEWVKAIISLLAALTPIIFRILDNQKERKKEQRELTEKQNGDSTLPPRKSRHR